MKMTLRKPISFTFNPRDVCCLCVQIGISFARAKVTCAVLEKTSYFYHNLRQLPRHLKHVKERCCYPLTLICLDAIGAVCHHFGLFIADLGRRVVWLTSGAGASYNLANIRTRADCGSSSCGWGVCLFSLVYHFFLLSPSSWETARYRLKYCLAVKPKTTNQPTQY